MCENEFIAKNIRDIRKKLNQTQINFAANCGISVEEISLIERNKADVRLSTLQKIAAYIGKSVVYLLSENPEELYLFN